MNITLSVEIELNEEELNFIVDHFFMNPDKIHNPLFLMKNQEGYAFFTNPTIKALKEKGIVEQDMMSNTYLTYFGKSLIKSLPQIFRDEKINDILK
jgi:hypothetical protein